MIYINEFCYVKILFDAYTWQSINTMNLIMEVVMTSQCWNNFEYVYLIYDVELCTRIQHWCVMVETKIIFTWG